MKAAALACILLAFACEAAAQAPRLEMILRASQPFERYGYAVATADFNADGYGDLVVGAPQAFLPLRLEAGRGEVHFGAARFDSVLDVHLRGTITGAQLGTGFSAGDVNADGVADMLVFSNVIPPGPPRVNVHYGGPSFGLTIHTSYGLQVPSECSAFLLRAVPAGDVNGDGHDDVVAAAWCYGKVGVYLGGPAADGIPDFQHQLNEAFNDAFPSAVGDVNADGYDDFFVGRFAGSGIDPAPSVLYLGAATMDSIRRVTFTDGSSDDGVQAHGLGDFNGDGYDDMAVTSANGQMRFYWGGPAFDTVADQSMTGAPGKGTNVFAADVNGDDHPDLLIGYFTNNQVHVFFGGATADLTPDLSLDGALGDGEWFGHAVSAIDMDGDGRLEILVGAPMADPDLDLGGGRLYVYSYYAVKMANPPTAETWSAGSEHCIEWTGSEPVDVQLSLDAGRSWTTLAANLPVTQTDFCFIAPNQSTPSAQVRVVASGKEPTRSTAATSGFFRIVVPAEEWPAAAAPAGAIAGNEPGAREGFSVDFAGDFDADGRPDVVTGAPFQNGSAGQVRVFGAAAEGWTERLFEGEGGAFGSSVAGDFDFDGDGYTDVLAGAPLAGPSGTGRAYVFRGGPDAPSPAAFVFEGESPADAFGETVATPGDVNGDGYDDAIVFAPDHGTSGQGRLYVYFGGPAADATADLMIGPGIAGARLLTLARSSGDLDLDGIHDVAYALVDAAGARALHVHRGGPALSQDFDFAMPEPARGEDFGAAITWVSDFDGAGGDDLAVGAPSHSGSGPQRGRVYIYSGGFTPESAPSRWLEGTANGGLFGRSISPLGDVNGDERADIAIAAASGDSGEETVYIFFGAGDNQPDLLLDRPHAQGFGFALCAAGDWFEDGLRDVVVGAPYGDPTLGEGGGVVLLNVARYVLDEPDGTTWLAGSAQKVTWRGAEPATVWLVDDDGRRALLAAGAGGRAVNEIEAQAPAWTARAHLELSPTNDEVDGTTVSAVSFHVVETVRLTSFSARWSPDGVLVEWSTDPPASPNGLAGYELYRVLPGGTTEGPLSGGRLTEPRYVDRSGRPGTRYELVAIDASSTEYPVGTASFTVAQGLRAWPVPSRGGPVTLQFAPPLSPSGAESVPLDVVIYDARGRRIATLAAGPVPVTAGVATFDWNGRTDAGGRARPGAYFVRTRARDGFEVRTRITLLR